MLSTEITKSVDEIFQTILSPEDSSGQYARSEAGPSGTYFIEVVRLVVLKGSDFHDIREHFLIITGMAVFFNVWAVWNYRKTS